MKIVRNNTMRDERIEGILPLTLFCLSSGAIYIALEIFTQSYSQHGRYFYVTLTLLLVLLVAIIFRVFGNKSAMLLAVPIVLVCALANIVWCVVILNQTKESDREIIAFLDEAEEQGYKNVVIYNSGYAWTQALTNIKIYAGDSAFDWSVTMDGYVSDNYNFDKLIFVNSDGPVCAEIDKKTIQVFDEKTQEAVLLDKDDVCFAGISGISKMWGKYGEAQRNYYYGYQEFSESADCYGVKYYSASADTSMNYDLVRKEELIYIDVGNETEKKVGVVLDKPYGEVFLTNRYTGSTMEYRFSNLPEEKQLAVVIDGYEWWQYDDEKRIYHIEIITDNRAYKLDDIDTYLLGYVENSKIINLYTGS